MLLLEKPETLGQVRDDIPLLAKGADRRCLLILLSVQESTDACN
jgi:hypothetical protein